MSSQNDDGDTKQESKQQNLGLFQKRRDIVDNIDEKDNLDTLESPDSISDLTDALHEIHIKEYSSPPTEIIEKVEAVHDQLPEEAQPHFVTDDTLIRRINAARNFFNTYMNRVRRVKEMPSPVEAGPANYPAKKARKRVESSMKGYDEMEEKLDRVRAGANGARQRALNAIGSSIAEQNEKEREETRQSTREDLESGDLVGYRNPRVQIGEVIRVNKKSIRVRRPNPRAGQTKPMSDELEPDILEGRVQLDSDFLTPLVTDTDVAEYEKGTAEGVTSVEELRNKEGFENLD